MNMTDPIADMLTRIRNAVMARHTRVLIPCFSPERRPPRSSRRGVFSQESEKVPNEKTPETRQRRLDKGAIGRGGDQNLNIGRRLIGEPALRQANSRVRRPKVAHELRIVDERQIVRPGAVERCNVDDAALDAGIRLRLYPRKRRDLAQGQTQRPFEELRLGHSRPARADIGSALLSMITRKPAPASIRGENPDSEKAFPRVDPRDHAATIT